MSRITSCFSELAASGRKALIPYIVAGDPDRKVTLSMMHSLVENGADIIELGVPFSDPMAEGPVIQLAHERALHYGISLHDVLDVVREFREQNSTTPVVLMGYANPVENMGYEAFAKAASAAGVDGVLTVDMPPEESAELKSALSALDMDMVYLLAPTSSLARIKQVAEVASGYLYYVSLKGVTGAGHLDVDDVKARVAEIRKYTDLPLSVGFGIKDATSAAAIAPLADGIVVGSALVNCIGHLQEADHSLEEIQQQTNRLMTEIRAAIDASH